MIRGHLNSSCMNDDIYFLSFIVCVPVCMCVCVYTCAQNVEMHGHQISTSDVLQYFPSFWRTDSAARPFGWSGWPASTSDLPCWDSNHTWLHLGSMDGGRGSHSGPLTLVPQTLCPLSISPALWSYNFKKKKVRKINHCHSCSLWLQWQSKHRRGWVAFLYPAITKCIQSWYAPWWPTKENADNTGCIPFCITALQKKSGAF